MIPTPDDQDKLDAFNDHMLLQAEAMQKWLDKRFGYSAVVIFFLCSMLDAQLQAGWPDEDERPEPYKSLAAALNKVGAELGPMIAAVEIEGLDYVKQYARRPH